MVKKENIYVTYDYSIFNRLEGNRDVDNKRIKIIVDSIKQVGYISNPIIVNKKMEVIDGQGRIEALKRLEMPIEYRIIDENVGVDECRAMNLKPTGWKINDFVNSYAELNNENYVKLKKLEEKYHFGYSILYSISVHTVKSGYSSQEVLRRGLFLLNDERAKEVDSICEYLCKFKDIQKSIGGRKDLFYGLIAWIAMLDNVDLNRLNVAMHQQRSVLTPFAKTEVSLREISQVYNKGYSKKKHRYFDYEWKTKGTNDN